MSFTGVQPPTAGTPFDSIAGWEWASRITNQVAGLSAPTEILASINILPLNNAFTGNNTFAGTSTFNGQATFNAISHFNAAVQLAAGVPITFDAAAARNRIFFDPIASQLKMFSNNIQTLTFDASANVTVNAGDLTIQAGKRFNIGNSLSIRADGVGWNFENAGSEIFRVYNGGLVEVTNNIAPTANVGAASALPALPAGYWSISVIGLGVFKIPIYN